MRRDENGMEFIDDGAEDEDWQVAAHIVFQQVLERAVDAHQ